jgi:sodium-dependent dicarboxylate transporter 2/3/5
MTSFAASIGGLATPIGTPPNVIGLSFIRRELGIDFPFFKWCLIGVPVVIVLYLFLFGYLNKLCPSGAHRIADSEELVARERREVGPMTRGQISTLIAFSATVVMWVVPGLIALFGGDDSPLYRTLTRLLPEGVAAVLGASLLFLLPGRGGERALTWRDAVQIDWGIVLLYGGGFALGTLSFETGLADALGRGFTGWFQIQSSFGLLVASTVVAVILSETTSNTAAANMIVPVVISIAKGAGLDPLEPALGATMGASLGFMLPVSTPCNAIVYGSGYIPLSRMMRYGLILDVVGSIVIIALVRTLLPILR